MSPLHRRRLVWIPAVLLLAVALGLVLRLAGDDGDPAPVLEGGSSFGAGPRPAADHGARQVPEQELRRKLPLPVERAAARLFLVGFEGTDPSAPFFERLRERGWGGVVLERANYVEPGQLAALAGEVGVVAKAAGQGAPIVAAYQPGGEGTAFANLPPREAALTPSARQAGEEARRAGEQLRALGIRMTLAPVASLGSAGGPWEGLAYGDEPAAVARAVRAAVDAYRAAGVAPAVGRFPGEGAASQDPGAGPATVGLGLDELRAADLVPFEAVVRRAPAIQLSTSLYAAFDGVTPATLLPDAVDTLRGMGFGGVVVSGDLSAATLATGGTVADAAVEALRAGCDLLWVPGDVADQERAYGAVLRAIRSGSVPAERVAGALQRIAALKRAAAIR